MFDLGHVREKKETDKEWVNKAMKGLEERCGAKKVIDFASAK